MNLITNPITFRACGIALLFGALTISGCNSNTGVVAPPEISAEEQAQIEARQAEYSKSMQESYGK